MSLSNLNLFDGKLAGFFCHLEDDQNGGEPELRILLDSEAGLLPQVIHLMPGGSLLDGMKMTVEEAEDVSIRRGYPKPPIEITGANFKNGVDKVGRLVSLVIYLCSNDPDISGPLTHVPKPVKTKTGLRYFPPSKPVVRRVGVSIGALLQSNPPTGESLESTGTHASPRPHIRRAHWHSYWTGPKRSILKVHWLHPMFVGAKTGSESGELCMPK